MAENIGTANLGEALGLGTNATPYRGTPLTTAVKNNQDNELHKALTQAQAEARRQKALEQLNTKFVLSPPSLSQRWSKRGQDIARKGVEEHFLNTGNLENQSMNEISTRQVLGTMAEIDNMEQGVFRANVPKPKFIRELSQSVDVESDIKASKDYDPYIHDNITLIETPDGGVSFMYDEKFPNQNVKNLVDHAIKFRQQGNDLSQVGSALPNYIGTVNKLSAQERRDLATDLIASSRPFSIQISTDMEDDVRKEREKYLAKGMDMGQATFNAKVDVATRVVNDNYHDLYGYKGEPTSKEYSPAVEARIAGLGYQVTSGEYARPIIAAIKDAGGNPMSIAGADFLRDNPNFNPEWETVTFPKNSGHVVMKNPKTKKQEEILPFGMVYVDGMGKDDGWYVYGSSKQVAADGASVGLGNLNLDKVIKITKDNWAESPKSTGIPQKDFEKAINSVLEDFGGKKRISQKKILKSTSKVDDAIDAFKTQFNRLPTDAELQKIQTKYA